MIRKLLVLFLCIILSSCSLNVAKTTSSSKNIESFINIHGLPYDASDSKKGYLDYIVKNLSVTNCGIDSRYLEFINAPDTIGFTIFKRSKGYRYTYFYYLDGDKYSSGKYLSLQFWPEQRSGIWHLCNRGEVISRGQINNIVLDSLINGISTVAQKYIIDGDDQR